MGHMLFLQANAVVKKIMNSMKFLLHGSPHETIAYLLSNELLMVFPWKFHDLLVTTVP